MLSLQNFNLRSLSVKSTAELAIIVIGVLLALSADGWWVNQQERAEEAEILQAMAEDFSVSEELVGDELNILSEILDDLKTLSEGSAGGVAQIDDALFIKMLHNGLWEVPVLTVQMSAYNEILGSGRMRLINDPALRRALAEYDQDFIAASARLSDVFQHQQTKLDPYLLSNFQMSQFSPFALKQNGSAAQLETPTRPLDHRPLLDDDVLQNLIASKYYLLANTQVFARELLQSLDEIGAMLGGNSIGVE